MCSFRISMKNEKSQISIEFIAFLSLAVLILIFVLPFAVRKNSEMSAEKNYLVLKDLGESIENEIYLALIVEDGYSRNFSIPDSIGANALYIAQNNSVQNATIMNLYTSKTSRQIRVPKIQGQLKTGQNTIRKEEGMIHVS